MAKKNKKKKKDKEKVKAKLERAPIFDHDTFLTSTNDDLDDLNPRLFASESEAREAVEKVVKDNPTFNNGTVKHFDATGKLCNVWTFGARIKTTLEWRCSQ
jgi:hypothetical protein